MTPRDELAILIHASLDCDPLFDSEHLALADAILAGGWRPPLPHVHGELWSGPWRESYAAAAEVVQDVLDEYTATDGHRILFSGHHGDRAIANLLVRGWRPPD